jgi:diguanylate cyclase (GGDEF)-like protein/PAS domain S-box-containing protein
MYQLIVENTLDIIIQYGPNRERIYVSPASREMLGYDPSEMMGIPVTTIIHPDDYPIVHPKFFAFGPEQPSLQLTYRARRKDGNYLWVEGHYRHVASDGTSIAVLRDVNDRKMAELMLQEANEKLEEANGILRRLAQQDGLTGLANRRRFDEMMEQEIRRSARQQEFLAILLLDVDCFKAYNDLYGHVAGDECLRDIGRCLEAAIRRPGDCAARYGGEEFVMLLPATDLAGATLLAEKLRQGVVDLTIKHLGSPHHVVTISVGASAMIPYADDDPSLLLDAADRELYRAKASGRNTVHASQPNTCAPVA